MLVIHIESENILKNQILGPKTWTNYGLAAG